MDWADASHSSGEGWTTLEDFKPQLLTAQSAGYLVFDGVNEWGEELIVLSTSIIFQPEGKPHFAESFSIPKGMITKVTYL